jgi:8-oxo-dGTP pyrophosphatase MutT (NUDIX family)
MQDLTVMIDETRLNIRVAAIIRKDDKMLVSKWCEDMLSLIGGRVKIGESTQEALVREVAEETGLKVETSSLHAIVENFFNIDGQAFHEFCYVYDVALEDFQINPSAVDFDCQKMLWLPLSESDKLQPKVLGQVVKDEGQRILHLVNRD